MRQLDERGVSDFAVCGSSMGGYMAFALLRAAPVRVRALVLCGTRAAADGDAALAARREMAEQVRAGGVEAIVEPMTERLLCPRCRQEVHIADPVRGRIRRCSADGVVAAIEAIAGARTAPRCWATSRPPRWWSAARADVIVPLEELRAMAAAIPGARLHELEGAAHLPNLEQPMAFTALLGDFLDGTIARV